MIYKKCQITAMGINAEWSAFIKKDAQLITVVPQDAVWPDPAFPNFSVILSDQTATMQQMNFKTVGTVITSGIEMRRRVIAKFVKENLQFQAEHIVLLWDKPWKTKFRTEMYSTKRYVVPSEIATVPKGKTRGEDGRFYYPHEAPLPKYNSVTNAGVKECDLITDTHMYPLSQMLSAAWTKANLAAFIFNVLWDFAASRPEHIVFDSPFLNGDILADGKVKCNKAACAICATSNIPRHSEADVLFHFHIKYLNSVLPQKTKFLVRGTNDRDLLVVLAFPLQVDLANNVWWCKGSNGYGMGPSGAWVKWIAPGVNIGACVQCNEFVSMGRFVKMMGGSNQALLLTRLTGLFLLGADYCTTPRGLTCPGLFKSLMETTIPFVYLENTQSLMLHVKEFHYFLQHAKTESPRCRTQLNIENLLENTLRAIYSLAYYTGFHRNFLPEEIGTPVGPDIEQYGFHEGSFQPEVAWITSFRPLLNPVLASAATSLRIIIQH